MKLWALFCDWLKLKDTEMIKRKTCNYCDGSINGSKRWVAWKDVRACSDRCEYALSCLLDGCSLNEVKGPWEANVSCYAEYEEWLKTHSPFPHGDNQ
jgi:hypothetical protein